MKYPVICCVFICLCFSCKGLDKHKSNNKYWLNDTYYLEATGGVNNNNWICLCNKKTQICLNIYPEVDHFNRVENIQIQKVANDTAVYVAYFRGLDSCTYREDTLIMSQFKVISKSVEKNCPRKL